MTGWTDVGEGLIIIIDLQNERVGELTSPVAHSRLQIGPSQGCESCDAAHHQLHRHDTWHARIDAVRDRSSTLAVVACRDLPMSSLVGYQVVGDGF